jgi:cell division septation protein DedD
VYRKRALALYIPLLTFLLGCGTTGETEQTAPPTPPPPPASQPDVAAPPKEFESRTDTVSGVHGVTEKIDTPSTVTPNVRWLVQIGAFKDPLLAKAAQEGARQRYPMTVLNDYNPLVSLYQIRIGFFTTKEGAQSFRDRIQKEFPEEYKGAWVVQLNE